MSAFDERLSIGHQPLWRQVFYSVQVGTPRCVSRLWRCYTLLAAALLPFALWWR